MYNLTLPNAGCHHELDHMSVRKRLQRIANCPFTSGVLDVQSARGSFILHERQVQTKISRTNPHYPHI